MVTLGQLFKFALNLKQYVATKHPHARKSVTSLGPYYSFGGYLSSHDCDTTSCWQKHCGGCLLDGGFAINIMMGEFRKQLGLPSPKPTPYTLRMADQIIIKLVGLIKDLQIQIYEIPYIATFMIMKNNVLDSTYSIC